MVTGYGAEFTKNQVLKIKMKGKIIMKNHFKSVLFSAVSALILFAGCSKETPLPDDSEITATETTTEIFSETVSDSPVTETQEEETEAVTESKSYEPYQLRLYDSLGTGIPRPDDYGEDLTTYYLEGELDDILSLLKDKTNAEKIKAETDALYYLALENRPLYEEYIHHWFWEQKDTYTYTAAYNGFLFHKITYYPYAKQNSFPYEYCEVFDLRTGELLELSDMFFEGEEFLDLLNEKIRTEIQKLAWEDFETYTFDYVHMKREFAGLPEDGFCFNDKQFYFPFYNPYFSECINIDVRLSDFDTVFNVPYDMSELFEEGAEEVLYMHEGTKSISSVRSIHSKHFQTGNIDVYLLDGSPYLTDEQEEFLNTQALNMTDEILKKIRNEYEWLAYTDNEPPLYHTHEHSDGTVYEYIDIFLIYINIKNDIAHVHFIEDSAIEEPVPSYSLYFDIKTLEPLDTKQLFELTFGDDEYEWDHIYTYSPDNETMYNSEGFKRDEIPDADRIKPENIDIYDSYIRYYGKVDGCWVWGQISRS